MYIYIYTYILFIYIYICMYMYIHICAYIDITPKMGLRNDWRWKTGKPSLRNVRKGTFYRLDDVRLVKRTIPRSECYLDCLVHSQPPQKIGERFEQIDWFFEKLPKNQTRVESMFSQLKWMLWLAHERLHAKNSGVKWANCFGLLAN